MITPKPVPERVIADICVGEFTTNERAATPPMVTLVAPKKLVPVIMTEVAPPVEPEFGVKEVTIGGTAVNVKTSLALAVPPGVITSTVIGPATRAGVIATIRVELKTVNDVALVPPNLTPVAPIKFVPLIVTDVPPEVVPLVGEGVVAVGRDE